MNYYDMFSPLRVYIYGRGLGEMSVACEELLINLGCVVSDSLSCDLAVAPCHNQPIPATDTHTPKYGTLVFHPSLLPFYRGADAIRWQFKNGEKIGGGTWFWCSTGLDNGDICEQEVCPLQGTPKEYYSNRIVPLSLRTLTRAIISLQNGGRRAYEQQHGDATYSYGRTHPAYYTGA